MRGRAGLKMAVQLTLANGVQHIKREPSTAIQLSSYRDIGLDIILILFLAGKPIFDIILHHIVILDVQSSTLILMKTQPLTSSTDD